MTLAKAVARAWDDPDFKKKLVGDPHAALADCGVEIPTGKTIKVFENTDETFHLVLPASPDEKGEVVLDDLEKIAGGTVFATLPWSLC